MRILTYVASYLPGHKAGGALRSIVGLVDNLHLDFQFWIVTSDRDLGDLAPYRDVPIGVWTERHGTRIYYAAPSELTPTGLRRIAEGARPDLHYLNSVFSRRFSMLPGVLAVARRIPRAPLVIAPRGELSPGALGIKRTRKRLFLEVARRAGFYAGATWQASTELERDEIKANFPGADVMIAGDLVARAVDPPGYSDGLAVPRRPKRAGAAALAFVSRISPVKNLPFALEALRGVRGEVVYDVYGPLEDAALGEQCRRIAASLPANIRVELHGDVPHHAVARALAAHHAFLLPTRGENFGHAILEALLAGCITIISDTTPWRGLAAQGAGWDLPLADPAAFTRAVQRVVDMDDYGFATASTCAAAVGLQRANDPRVVAQNRALFETAVRRGAGH